MAPNKQQVQLHWSSIMPYGTELTNLLLRDGFLDITVSSKCVWWHLKSPAFRLFTQPFVQVQIKETSKLHITGHCVGNSPGTGEFPTQRASNAERISIWRRHHDFIYSSQGECHRTSLKVNQNLAQVVMAPIHSLNPSIYAGPGLLQIGDWGVFSTLRPRQDGRHFHNTIFKCIFSNENVHISIKISLKFVPKGPINNIPALDQTMAWCWPGDKLLSELMMVSLLMHICHSASMS